MTVQILNNSNPVDLGSLASKGDDKLGHCNNAQPRAGKWGDWDFDDRHQALARLFLFPGLILESKIGLTEGVFSVRSPAFLGVSLAGRSLINLCFSSEDKWSFNEVLNYSLKDAVIPTFIDTAFTLSRFVPQKIAMLVLSLLYGEGASGVGCVVRYKFLTAITCKPGWLEGDLFYYTTAAAVLGTAILGLSVLHEPIHRGIDYITGVKLEKKSEGHELGK